MKNFYVLLVGVFLLLGNDISAQVSITTAGAANTENFDGMGSSATATLPTGFKIGTDWASGTTVTTLAYGSTGTGVVTGTSSGGVINWANGITASATDRSLGFLNTGTFTSPRSIVYAFTNNTGSTQTDLTITFDYEKTRSGTRQFDWTFFHGNTSTPSTSAISGDQSNAADANNTTIFNPPTTTSKSVSLTGLSIANGATYYLKWTFTGLAGSSNGQGIGIDNFSITLGAACTAPTVTTETISNLVNTSTTTVTLGATVSAAGGGTLVTTGVDYGTSTSVTSSATSANTTLGAFTQNITGLTPNTVYYYRGKAINSCSATGYSAATPVSTNFLTYPNPPTSSAATSITNTSFFANWAAPAVAGSASYTYTVEVATDNLFSSIVATTSSIASGTLTTQFTGLTQNTPYWYRVKTVNATGASVVSSSQTLTTIKTPPTLTAAVGATVDAAFNVTYPTDAAWMAAITSITVNGTTLTAGSSLSAGNITFTPSASNLASLLQTSGSKTIVVIATGYVNATVTQAIAPGVATKLAISTQPTAPVSNGGVLAQQPVILIKDQYNNTVTSSTATVDAVAVAGSSSWTIGGTTSVNAVAGVATFTNLTASSAVAVTGASIQFTSTIPATLTSITSNTFSIVQPAPPNDLCGNATPMVLDAPPSAGTFVGSTYTTITSDYGPAVGKHDVWYSYTSSCTGTFNINVFNSAGMDIDIYAYAGSCPASGTGMASAVYTNTTEKRLSVPFVSGTTYYVRVLNWNTVTAAPDAAFTLEITSLPAISSPTATSITSTSAVLGGDITNIGPCNTVTERGIYWSTTAGQVTSGIGTKVSETPGPYSTGTFTEAVSSLPTSTTIYYAAFAKNSSGTVYTVEGSFTTPPTNDLCGGAISLIVDDPAIGGTMIGATATAITSDYAGVVGKNDVWYKFVPACGGQHTITVNNSAGMNIDLFAYSTSCPASGTGVGNALLSSTTTESLVLSTVTSGATYYVRVIKTSGTDGAFTINVAKTIVVPSVSIAFTSSSTGYVSCSGTTTITSGSTVVFTASPTNGGAGAAYQWKVNGTNQGSNSSTFSYSSYANGDVVTCVMTSGLCVAPANTTVTSNAVTVNVVSGTSTVVTSTGGAYTPYVSNINYSAYQSATPTSASAVPVHEVRITDGAPSDGLPTILTAITFSYTFTTNDPIRAARLFKTSGGTQIGIGVIGTASGGVNTITFTGLSGADFTAANGSTKDIVLGVTFNSTVTDNDKIVFSVTSVTSDTRCNSSQFAATNGGGATSDNTGNDNNRIEVFTTALVYSAQPATSSTYSVGVAISPSVVVNTVDGNGNLDLDNTSTITINASTASPSCGTAGLTGNTAAAVAGVATFNSLTIMVPNAALVLTASDIVPHTVAGNTFAVVSTTTASNLVNWNFPSGSQDAIADGGISANTALTITTNATSPIYTAAGASGAGDGAMSATGWDNGSGTKYFLISNITTTGYSSLNLISKQTSSGTGPKDWKVQYNIGSGWVDVPLGTSTISGSASNFPSTPALNVSLPVACENQAANLSIRWIMTSNTSQANGTVASGGTSRIDSIFINGFINTAASGKYYQSKATGAFEDPCSWETSTTGVAGTYVNASMAPDFTSSSIDILNTHTITINAANTTLDQVTIKNGGTLAIASSSLLTLNNGTGTDLTVEGTLIDNGTTSNGVIFSTGATWAMGAIGTDTRTLVKTNTSSASVYQNNYSGGIATIPSTSTWIQRYTGLSASIPFISTGAIYPNLTYESTSGAWTPSGIGVTYNGSGNYATILGNFDVGGASGNSTNKVTFTNENTNAQPLLINGNLTIRTGSVLTNVGSANGTGLEVQGNISVDGTLTNNGGTGALNLTGSLTTPQTISGSGTTNLFNVTVNKIGVGGGITLSRDISIPASGTLTISNGLLNAQTQNLDGDGNLTMTGGGLQLTKDGVTQPQLTGTYSLTNSTVYMDGTGTGINAQTVRGVNYYNLNLTAASGGARILSSTGTIGIANVFTPNFPTQAYTVTGSTVDFNGVSTAQDIPAFTFYNVGFKNGGLKTLIGSDTVYKAFTLGNSTTISDGTSLALGDNDITLHSDNSSTANVTQTPMPLANVTYGTGRFVIERYLPMQTPFSGRRWRLLGVPIRTLNAPKISESWQEGAVPTSSTTDITSSTNPHPGYGTHITNGIGSANNATGFDAGSTANPSIYKMNPGSGAWTVPGSTNGAGTAITDYNGYMLFVRGNRSIVVSNQYINTTGGANLRIKGKINIGNLVKSVTTNKQLLSNPYPSSISLATANYGTSTMGSVAGRTYYLWDPKLLGSKNVGGWVTFSSNGNNTFTYVPYVNTAPYNTGISSYTTDGVIESGTAFMIDNTIGAANFTFHEADKKTTSTTVGLASRPVTGNRPVTDFASFYTNLVYIDGFGNPILADGVATIYGDQYNNEIGEEDSKKMLTFLTKEKISLLRNDSILAIERRQTITRDDTIFLQMNKLDPNYNYQLQFIGKNFRPDLTAYLVDKYLNETYMISTEGNSVHNFETDNASGSVDTDRFKVVFKSAENSPLPIKFISINANIDDNAVKVTWKIENEINTKFYEIERSTDGIHFVKVGQVSATGSLNYNWIDPTMPGNITYYRIVGISTNETKLYSSIVNIKRNDISSSMAVYPNPVIDGTVGLQLTNMPAGKYQFALYNNVGQLMIKQDKVINGTNEVISLGNVTAKGVYHIEVLKPGDKKETIKFVY